MGNKLCSNTPTVQDNTLNLLRIQQPDIPLKYLQEEHCYSKNSPNNQSIADFSTNVHHVLIPEPTREVLNTLSKHDFFKNEIDDYEEGKRQYYEDDVYEGQLGQHTHLPHGFGKAYKKDGSLYIGEFRGGAAQGRGVYIFPDGSFVSGHFLQNELNCELGYYQNLMFKYRGGFKGNLFEGHGAEQSQDYNFQGNYEKGKWVQGKLVWKDYSGFTYFYEGQFDKEGNFHGKGKMATKRGVYQGQFSHGVKEGKGYFKGVNGIKYKGDYKNGEKEGYGTIYNSDETIAYKGKLKNGLPHGAGTAYINNKTIVTSWYQGIDIKYLPFIGEDQY